MAEPAHEPKGRQGSIASHHESDIAKAPPSVTSPPSDRPTFGVYRHNILRDNSVMTADLISTAPNFDTAHAAMLIHVVQDIKSNPEWGRTRALITKSTYEMLDRKNVVLLRYDISPIRSLSTDAHGVPIWERVTAAPAISSANGDDEALEHYGLYLTLPSAAPKFTGGFTSLGEATHAMKVNVRAYTAEHADTVLGKTSVELFDETGEVAMRYEVKKGRMVRGVFVREEEWVDGTENAGEKSGVLRLPVDAAGDDQADVDAGVGVEPKAEVEAEVKAEVGAQEEEELHCHCRRPDDMNLMLACDNDDSCTSGIEWYHAACVGVKRDPGENEKWYCPTCVSASRKRRRGSGDQDKHVVEEEEEDDADANEYVERAGKGRGRGGKGKGGKGKGKGKGGKTVKKRKT